MVHFCLCNCHDTPDEPRIYPYRGVDVRGVIAAVTACAGCVNAHTPALRGTALPNEVPAPRRGVEVITPEGKRMSWGEYEREMEKRADSWRHQDPEKQ